MGRKSEKEKKHEILLQQRAKWVKENTKTISIRFIMTYDEDKTVYEHVMKQRNKTEYFRRLVMKDIEDSKK